MANYVRDYFYKYLPHLGDLDTYNEDVRTLDFIEEGAAHKIRFLVEWLPAEHNARPLLEIHISIRGASRHSLKGWVYRNGDGWDFQIY